MQISVVIPAYNEESAIEATLREVLAYLPTHFNSYEVIVVNDGSKDATAAIVSRIPGVTLVQYEQNRGKGYAVKHGMLAALGEVILFMDADNSTKITELDHCMKEIRDYDIVIGSRALADSRIQVSQNPLKRSLGRLGNLIIKSVLGVPFQDTQCGYKLFRRSVLVLFEQQTIDRWGFDFEILYLAHRQGFRIYESPVHWENNFDSKVSVFSYPRTLFELLMIRAKHLFPKKP
jgi:glycosyltransferase involved in cell wall biosynthesis